MNPNSNNKTVSYPENLYLKEAINKSGYKSKYLAEETGTNYNAFIRIINGREKGTRTVALLRKRLGLD